MANRVFFFIALPCTIICFVVYTMVVFTPNYMTYTEPIPNGMKDGEQVQNYRMGAIQNCTKNGTFHSTKDETETVAVSKRSLSDEGSTTVPALDASNDDDDDDKKTTAKKSAASEAKTTTVTEVKNTTATDDTPTDPDDITYTGWDCHLLNWKILTNQIFLAYLSTTAVAWFTLLGAFLVSLIKVVLDWVPNDKIKAARILCSRNFGLGLMSAHITAGGFIIASTVLMIVIWKTSLAAMGWKLGFNVYLGIAVAIGSFFTAIMWFMDVKKMGVIPI